MCDRPLAVAQRAQRCCEASECKAELRRRSPSVQAASLERAAFEQSAEHRRRSAASRGIAKEVAETFRPALIPVNKARVSKLPTARRKLFETHLRNSLRDAQRKLKDDPGDTPLLFEAVPLEDHWRSDEERAALSQLMIAGCTMCRGRCCLNGQEHAFHSVETLRKYLQRHPNDDLESIVVKFMNDMGEYTMTNGCVFQGEQGCTLDAERRSPTCHQYFCPGLRSAYDQHEAGEPVRAYFVQIRKGKIARTQFIEVGPRTP